MRLPTLAAQGPHADAATMASARACLDVLRGASVLVQQTEEVLMQLLALHQDEGSLLTEHRDGGMFQGSESIAVTQTGTGYAEAALHGAKSATEDPQQHLVAQIDARRLGLRVAARGQQQQQENEHVECQEGSDRRMLGSLVNSLLRVLQGPPCIRSSEAARPSAEMQSHQAGSAAERTEEHGVAGVHRKRSRAMDGARCQQKEEVEEQQQRSRSMSSTHTDVIAVRAGHQGPTSLTTATTATSIVLTSPDLLLNVIGYLPWLTEEPSRVKELGALALVCGAWRNAAQHESLWEPVAKVIIPRLADVENAPTTQAELQKAGGSFRRYLLHYGRMLSERNVVRWGGSV